MVAAALINIRSNSNKWGGGGRTSPVTKLLKTKQGKGVGWWGVSIKPSSQVKGA